MFTTTIKRSGYASRFNGTYEFGARMYRDDSGEWVVDLCLGYKDWETRHVERADSVLRGRPYKMVHQILPAAGDVIVHKKSGRKFVVGEPISDFIVYRFPLLENGKRVAILRAEEYYKD